MTKPFHALRGLRQKFMSREGRPLLITAISLLLVTIIGITLVSRMGSNRFWQIIFPNKEATIGENKADSAIDDTGGGTIVLPQKNEETVIPIQVNDPKDRQEINESEKIKEEKKKESRKKQENKNPVKDEDKKDLTPVVEQVEENKEPVDDKPNTPARTVKLESKVPVSLYLREPINASTVKEGQFLSFSVTGEVTYAGQTLIEQGAIATGIIKGIGRRKMSITLYSVKSASGDYLPFHDSELSGRIEEMLNNRNYNVFIKKGITARLK